MQTVSFQGLFSGKSKKILSVVCPETRVVKIAPDKVLFSSEKYRYFPYFRMKTYVVGTHSKCLTEVLQMSTHNMFPCRNKKK